MQTCYVFRYFSTIFENFADPYPAVFYKCAAVTIWQILRSLERVVQRWAGQCCQQS